MTERRKTYDLSDVFVPGGLPTITYNPREGLKLEDKVRDYLAERRKILTLAGPTKSGKTVLLHSILPGTVVWLSGGGIGSLAEFWELVGDKLGAPIERSETRSGGEAEAHGSVFDGTAKPMGVGIGAQRTSTRSTSVTEGATETRRRPAATAAADALVAQEAVLVIDDFHYIKTEVQLEIIRNLKELVFNGLPVVLAVVPHRAYDAVRVEKEMTYRVEHLKIPFWDKEELLGIARHGFEALNVLDPDHLADRLADEAFQSPHLMQDFCLQLCKANGIRTTAGLEIALRPPDWRAFFGERASNASKAAFDRLARGPRTRSDRIERVLKDGTKTDIYGLVLRAIAHTGPLTQLTYEQLRTAIREVISSEPPQRQDVTRILEEMARIAREEVGGEPVVDYDTELSTLFIADPFFAFYLRWGIPGEAAPER
jgi:hypothetical protein